MRWPPDRERVLDVRTYKLGNLPAGGLAWSMQGWLNSVTVANADAATTCTVTLIDGKDATGEPLATIRIPAGLTVPIVYGFPGLPLAQGLIVTVDNGAIVGSVVIAREVAP